MHHQAIMQQPQVLTSVKYNFQKSKQVILQYLISSTYINIYIFLLQYSVQIIEEMKEKCQYLT